MEKRTYIKKLGEGWFKVYEELDKEVLENLRDNERIWKEVNYLDGNYLVRVARIRKD